MPVPTHEKAMELLKSTPDRYAYVGTEAILRYSLHEHRIRSYTIPDLSRHKSTFASNLVGIALNKRFKYKKHFNSIISDILKSGLNLHWEQLFYLKRFNIDMDNYDKSLEPISEHIVLNLVHFYSIFFVTIISLFGSIILLIFEIYF